MNLTGAQLGGADLTDARLDGGEPDWRPAQRGGPDWRLARRVDPDRRPAAFRRHWWSLLAERPEGFPWLSVAGRELTGVTVVDLDATIVHAASEKENARATYNR